MSFLHPKEYNADCVAPEIPTAVLEAFANFKVDNASLALPLLLTDGALQILPPVRPKDPAGTIQTALNELDAILSPRTPLYLLLRRNDSLIAITYVPYLAKEDLRFFFLEHRHELVEKLGKEHFSQSLICKEIGEVTDARSWTERDNNEALNASPAYRKEEEGCKAGSCEACTIKDLGYKRNKCRLCDRRMKNPITSEALDALTTLTHPGAAVQIVRTPRLFTIPILTPPARRHLHRHPRPQLLKAKHCTLHTLHPHPHHLPNIHPLPPPHQFPLVLHIPLPRLRFCTTAHEAHARHTRATRARRRRRRARGPEDRDPRAAGTRV